LRDIYATTNNYEEGDSRQKDWWVRAAAKYSDATGTIRNYFDGICNDFANRTTKGAIEGINNRLKLIKRQAYGFVSFNQMRDCCLAVF